MKKLILVWFFALAILGVYSLNSTARIRAYLPFIEKLLENKVTKKDVSYIYGKTPVVSLGDIQNPNNAYFKLKLRFRADSAEGYPNVFQSAPVNRGIRMEISGSAAAIIFPDKSVSGGLRGITLSTELKRGRWYELEIEVLNGTFVHATLDGRLVTNYADKGIAIETSQIQVGSGFNTSRVFLGNIENISITTGNYSSRPLKNIFYFVLILGLGSTLNKIFLRRRLVIPKSKKLYIALKHVDFVKYISIILICVFCLTLFTVYNLPLYPDEIQVRFWLSRMPYDFPEVTWGTPRCLSTFAQSIPLTMYLPNFIDWVIHGTLESPTSLRRVGVVVALLWVSGLTLYLNVKAKNSIESMKPLNSSPQGVYIIGFVIAMLSIGVFPAFLVINRQEQIILPTVVLLMSIFIASKNLTTKNTWLLRTALIISYFMGISLALYAHPKSLFLTPLFVIVGWKLFSHFKTRLPFILAMFLLIIHLVMTVNAFKYAFQCGDMPAFEEMLKSYSFDPASLFYAPQYFFDQAYHSLSRSSLYWSHLGFLESSETSYLPSIPLSVYAQIANIFIKLNLAVLFFIMIVILPYHYYRKDVVTGRFVTVNLALFMLFLCGIISAIFNLPKHWYDAGYLYALSIIVVVFFIGENFSDGVQKKITRIILLYLGSVALLSQVIFINRNLPAFMDGYGGPGIPIGIYEKNNVHDNLVAATKACNIDPIQSKKIVVDDFTYGYFRKSKLPMAITYIWLDSDDKSRQQFFSKVDSDGLVVNCSSVPSKYKQFVISEGNICCVPKKDITSVFSLH